MTRNIRMHAVKIAVGLWLGLSAAVSHAGVIYNVEIDTSSISGGAYSMAFDLFDGDGFGNNTIIVNDFMFGIGGAVSGVPNTTGGASGDISSTVTLMDTVAYSSFDQEFTAGSLLSFTIDISNIFSGAGFPDNLSFLILDDTGAPIPTTDPFGTDSFFTVDLTNQLDIQTFSSTDPNRAISAPQVVAAAVPAPGVIWLLASGLAGMAIASRRKARSGRKEPKLINGKHSQIHIFS